MATSGVMTAGISPGGWQEGVINVIEAAKKAGVRRFLLVRKRLTPLLIPHSSVTIMMRYGSQVTGYGSRVMGHGLWVTGYGLRVMGHGLWVTGYGLRVTGYGLRVVSIEIVGVR